LSNTGLKSAKYCLISTDAKSVKLMTTSSADIPSILKH
jgi:hypothetical protein